MKHPSLSPQSFSSQRDHSDLVVKESPQKYDYFSIFLWGVLLLWLYQVWSFAVDWAFAWLLLGVLILLFRQHVRLPFVGVVETPIFLALIAYLVTTLYLAKEEGIYDLAHDESLRQAMWISFAGIASFLLGLALALLPRKKNRVTNRRIPVSEVQAVLIYFLGFIFYQILVPLAPFSIRAIITVFGYCAPIGLFLLLEIYAAERIRWIGTWKFYLWLVALLAWAFTMIASGIFGATLLIVFLFLLQHARRSKLVFVGLLISGVIVAPLMQDTKLNYRQRISNENTSNRQTLVEVFQENFRKTILEGDESTYRKGISALAQRLCVFDVWFRVKNHMDTQKDFAGGKTVIDALAAGFIPRILWPNKPITGGASDLAIHYADMDIAEGTSVGVGAISEFYINGGTWAVVVGMLCLGYFGGGILRFGAFDAVQPLGFILSIFAFSQMVRPETNLSDILGGVLRLVFLWFVLRWWIVRQRRKGNRWMAHSNSAYPKPGP